MRTAAMPKPRPLLLTDKKRLSLTGTIDEAIATLRHSIVDFHDGVDEGISSWCYEDSAADYTMHLLLGIRGATEKPLLSNKSYRKKAGELFIRHIGAAQRNTAKPCATRTWWFLSLVDDRAFINTYRPEVDIPAFKRRVDALVRMSGLDAYRVEAQALTNYPGEGLGRTIMLNAHVMGTTPDRSIALP